MLRATQFHAMPVERSNLEAAAEDYARLPSIKEIGKRLCGK
jgi:hypothetical protein